MKKKVLIIQAGVFLIFIALAVILSQNVDTATELRSAVTSLGPLGWLGFIALYVAGTVLLFPGTIFTVAGALLFGLWLGFFLNIIGATIGAVAAYRVSRLMGKDAFDGLAPKKLRELEQKVSKRPFETVLILRLLPFIPYNALNYALGLTTIRTKPYFWGTLLGIAPTSFAYTYATVKVGEIVSQTGLRSLTRQDISGLLPVIALIIVLAILPIVVRRFQHNKLNKD